MMKSSSQYGYVTRIGLSDRLLLIIKSWHKKSEP